MLQLAKKQQQKTLHYFLKKITGLYKKKNLTLFLSLEMIEIIIKSSLLSIRFKIKFN